MGKKKKESNRKGKKKPTKRPQSSKWTAYGEKKKRFCPKCGPGVFMAAHTNRVSCGKCGYTEFKTMKKQEPKQVNEQKAS